MRYKRRSEVILNRFRNFICCDEGNLVGEIHDGV